jgi:AraC family transcriptional activator of pobA
MMNPLARPARLPMLVQRIESSLHTRTIALARRESGSTRVLVQLGDGEGRLEWKEAAGTGAADPVERMVIAPGLAWLAKPKHCRLIIEAGSTGHVAEIADDTLVRAVGDFAESATLMFMADSDMGLTLSERKPAHERIRTSLEAVIEETGRTQPGSTMAVVAHLRIILVQMMRISGLEETAGAGRGEDAHFLQRFRQLVEGHFRDRWPVARYAQALGITPDRLHAMCTRELGRPPKALVAERLAREAAMALERSTLSIEQLSHALGFRDPAHFSHFHKRMTGLAPGRFRKMLGSAAQSGEFSPPSFADWP